MFLLVLVFSYWSLFVFAKNPSLMLKKVVRNYQIGSSYYAAEGQMLCTEQGPRTKVPAVMDTSNKKQTIMIEADYVTCTQ